MWNRILREEKAEKCMNSKEKKTPKGQTPEEIIIEKNEGIGAVEAGACADP